MPRREAYLEEKILGRNFSLKNFRVMERNKVFERSNSQELEGLDMRISKLRIEKDRINAARQKLIQSRKIFNSTGKLIDQLQKKDLEDDGIDTEQPRRRARAHSDAFLGKGGLKMARPSIFTPKRTLSKTGSLNEYDGHSNNTLQPTSNLGNWNRADKHLDALLSPRIARSHLRKGSILAKKNSNGNNSLRIKSAKNLSENGSKYSAPKKVHFQDENEVNCKTDNNNNCLLQEEEKTSDDVFFDDKESADTLPPLVLARSEPRISSRSLPGCCSPKQRRSISDTSNEMNVLPNIVERRRQSLMSIAEIQEMVQIRKDAHLHLK